MNTKKTTEKATDGLRVGLRSEPSDTHDEATAPSSGAVECASCGHVGEPVGKGQCASCKCFVPGNVANLRHGLRRYEDTGLLPDDLRAYRATRYGELVEALGGAESLSPQRDMLAGHAINLEVTAALQLDFALRTGADTKRGREALADYRATVQALRLLLGDLGLERVSRTVSLADYMAERERAAGSDDEAAR